MAEELTKAKVYVNIISGLPLDNYNFSRESVAREVVVYFQRILLILYEASGWYQLKLGRK